MRTGAYSHLRQALDEIPVVDTHDHLRPWDHLEHPVTVGTLFRFSYIWRALRGPDGSANGVGPRDAPPPATDTWEQTSELVERVKYTSYYRWLLSGLRELYGLPDGELTGIGWEILTAELPRRYQNSSWTTEVLDRAHITSVIWDPFWQPGSWVVHEKRLLPSLRISSSLVAFHPDARDYGGWNVIRDWAQHFDMEVDSLARLEELIDDLIEENVRAGCRSLKSPIAYERTLRTGPGTRQEAAATFGKRPEEVSPEQRLAFGDYIIRFYLDRARELGLVAQIHTGLGRLGGSNPILLTNLFEDYPTVVFDLFHGGYPWIHEVGALAQNYPNVRLNLTWLPHLSTEAAVSALKEWIQVVPQRDRITWGADCWTVDEMYGALLGVKHVIARALSELVEDGYLGVDDATAAATSVLDAGGCAVFGLTHPN